MKKLIVVLLLLLSALCGFSQDISFLSKNGVTITIKAFDSAAVFTAINGKLNTGLAFLLSDTATKTWAWSDITGKPSYWLISDTAAKTWDWADITGKPSYWLISDTAAKTWAWTDITGTPNYQLVGATFFIGTTSIANNRASASQALTGITSIDGSAATLTTTRTLWGQNFNGSANVTGDITLGINSITMTGSIAATGARVTKGWFTDVESTNMFTVGGTSLTTVAQVFQNKTMTNSNNVLGGVTMTLGSDASWDLYVRNASGILERLGNGTTGQFLGANTAAKPSWQTPSGSGGITIATTTITGGVSGKVLYNNAGVVGEADANFTNYTSLANKDLLWYNSATSEWNNITIATLKTEFGTPANITGLISAGTNVTITGSGTSGSPYVINSSGGGSGITFQQELGYSAMRLF